MSNSEHQEERYGLWGRSLVCRRLDLRSSCQGSMVETLTLMCSRLVTVDCAGDVVAFDVLDLELEGKQYALLLVAQCLASSCHPSLFSLFSVWASLWRIYAFL